MSASVHLDSKQKEQLYVKEVKVDGQLRVFSFHADGAYGLSYQRDPSTGRRSGESTLRFNSTYLRGTNRITGRYEDGTFSLLPFLNYLLTTYYESDTVLDPRDTRLCLELPWLCLGVRLRCSALSFVASLMLPLQTRH